MANGLCVDLDNPILNFLAKCLINTLLNMGAQQLEAFKAYLQAQLAVLDAQIAGLIAQAAAYDFLAQQYKLAEESVKKELDIIQAKIAGLPLKDLDPTCFEWASLYGGLNGLFAAIRAPIEEILFELERITSFMDEIAKLRAEYEALKKFIFDLLAIIDILIVEAKCRQASIT
jgi:hypothetical protein